MLQTKARFKFEEGYPESRHASAASYNTRASTKIRHRIKHRGQGFGLTHSTLIALAASYQDVAFRGVHGIFHLSPTGLVT